MDVKGIACPACIGIRVHRVRVIRIEGKVVRVAVCSVCHNHTLLSPAHQPGIVCPKCGDIRLPRVFTRPYPGRIVRVRKCKSCGHRIRTRETVESFAG